MGASFTSTALTAELFNQIVKSLKSDAGRRFNEQRSKPRVGVRGKVRIVPCDGGAELDVWVRDLSATGIGILHTAPLENGTSFVAHFPRAGMAPLDITYLVAYSKPVTRGLFATGGRILSVDDPGR